MNIELIKRCRYCQEKAALLNMGDEGYPYRRSYGPMWVCVPCQAWVGCHPGTEKALGGLAQADLRVAKQTAHASFDPLWHRVQKRELCSQGKARRAAYAWLAEQMGMPKDACHIGHMDLDQCRQVVEVCKQKPEIHL
jgi:hypothetical protein